MRVAIKVFLVFILSILLLEAVARFFFESPYEKVRLNTHVSKIYQSDDELGWKNKPGTYEIKFQSQNSLATIPVEIGSKEERISFPNSRSNQSANRLFIGCSWTFGEGVSGSSAFPGIVAKALPKETILNLAVGGYSTLQSLLKVKNYFNQGGKTKEVVYGFLSHHEYRNVAPFFWRLGLSKASQSINSTIPFARLDRFNKLKLESSALDPYPKKICKMTALGCLGIHVYWRISDASLQKQQEVVTRLLFLEFKRVVAESGAKFTVLLLDPHSFRYESFLRGSEIDYLKSPIDAKRLSYDAHPNHDFHREMASVILNAQP